MKTTQDVKWGARDLERGSKKVENIMKRQEFWCCSRRCIILFVVLGIIIAIIIIVAATAGASTGSTDTNESSDVTPENNQIDNNKTNPSEPDKEVSELIFE